MQKIRRLGFELSTSWFVARGRNLRELAGTEKMQQTQQIAASRRKPFTLPFSLFLHDFVALCQ
jgi:hypothetical protein